jgi:hypothetical protein
MMLDACAEQLGEISKISLVSINWYRQTPRRRPAKVALPAGIETPGAAHTASTTARVDSGSLKCELGP